MLMALLLDLANIVGGFLLAAVLLRRVPEVGEGLGRVRDSLDRFGWIVGVVALVASGYWIIVHLTEGPRLFHFEIIGLAVGVALLWDRLTGRTRPGDRDGPTTLDGTEATGVALLLAILGLIAIIVGLQGLFTPDG
jgi:hypothetical protein